MQRVGLGGVERVQEEDEDDEDERVQPGVPQRDGLPAADEAFSFTPLRVRAECFFGRMSLVRLVQVSMVLG